MDDENDDFDIEHAGATVIITFGIAGGIALIVGAAYFIVKLF